MRDDEIVELYWKRSEQAIYETDQKYGKLVRTILRNVGIREEDVEECQNDAYLAVWNSIPPKKPDSYPSFLCRIVKNIGVSRFRKEYCRKRSAELVALEELEEILPTPTLEQSWSVQELGHQIDAFLGTVEPDLRRVFLFRYWYGYPVRDIADRLQTTENAISLKLARVRKNLRKYLEMEGCYEVG